MLVMSRACRVELPKSPQISSNLLKSREIGDVREGVDRDEGAIHHGGANLN